MTDKIWNWIVIGTQFLVVMPLVLTLGIYIWLNLLEYFAYVFRLTAAFREFLWCYYSERWWGRGKSYDEIKGNRMEPKDDREGKSK